MKIGVNRVVVWDPASEDSNVIVAVTYVVNEITDLPFCLYHTVEEVNHS